MRPNIVFITCHDLGQHLHCYGIGSVHSPHLDQLAVDGVLFEHNFCTAPQCSPSRAALHTGRYPHATGVLGLTHADFGWDLNEDEVHMAQRLHEAGYTTALVGVQHVTQTPERLGYDRLLPGGSAPAAAETAIDLLRHLKDTARPFYLEVGFFEPHRPYDRWGITPDTDKGVALPGYVPDCAEARAEFAALQGAIRAMDAAVGEILKALEELGLREETWVIFTVDHGIAMPRAKCTLYDPGIETALMMRWPAGGIAGGEVNDALVSNVDLVPTMIEALSMPVPATLQGRSFWPQIKPGAEATAPRTAIFAEKTYHSYYHPQRCIRTRTHKLIANLEKQPPVEVPGDVIRGPLYGVMAPALIRQPRQTFELYDLRADPLEMTSIAGQPAVAEIEAALRANLWQWMVATGDPLLQGPVASPVHRRAIAGLQAPPAPLIVSKERQRTS